MDELSLLYGEPYKINDYLQINSPTLREIKNFGEEKYFTTITTLCQTPSDCKVFLNDKLGLDWQDVKDFDLFTLLAPTLSLEYTSILFGDFDFSKLRVAQHETTGEIILVDIETNRKIDSALYTLMTNYLRKSYRLERRCDKAGNEITKKFFLEEERNKLKRNTNKPFDSILAPLISGLINCEQFKYNYRSVWNLTIYQFMDAVKRILKYKGYTQIMQGAYAGTVDISKIPDTTLNWLGAL